MVKKRHFRQFIELRAKHPMGWKTIENGNFSGVPSCIFKRVFRTPKPHKNRVKSVENDVKIAENTPIFSVIFVNFMTF